MTDFDNIDFFRGDELIVDPYPYFDHLRDGCPVQREPRHGVMMVTGYAEAVSVYTDPVTFSSCTSVSGPFPGFPVALEGDDVSDLIEQYRDGRFQSCHLVSGHAPGAGAHSGGRLDGVSRKAGMEPPPRTITAVISRLRRCAAYGPRVADTLVKVHDEDNAYSVAGASPLAKVYAPVAKNQRVDDV